MVLNGQVRVRKEGASVLASAERVRVGDEHPMLVNVFQLYDATTVSTVG